MRVGFTGSREGMTAPQFATLVECFRDIYAEGKAEPFYGVSVHHGDCEGADNTASEQAQFYGFWIVSHPPINPKLRAYTLANEIREPKEYLERDRDIVAETDWLIATPNGPERPHSGTWYTINYAIGQGKPVTIIWPDGTLEER